HDVVPVAVQAIDCTATGTTSCTDATVLNASTYYYYAVALDADGFESAASNFNGDCDAGPDCVVARPLNPGPPSAPTGVTVRDAGIGGHLLVSWNPNPEPDLKSYTVRYGTTSGQYGSQLLVGSATTGADLAGLTDGVRYYVAVSATNTSGHESPLSVEVADAPHLIQGIAPPRAIADLQVSISGSDLVLTWSRPLVDIYDRPTTVVGYDVYKGGSPGFRPFDAPPLAHIGDPAVTTYVDPAAAGPAAGDAYYLVSAIDANGYVSGTGRELPNGISDLSVELTGTGLVHLSWSAVGTDFTGLSTLVDHYQIHQAGHPLPRASLGSSTLVLDNVHDLAVDLTAAGAPLYFSVVAVDDRGNLSPF
ncbi:MAG TPA: fibronectin type III domain-containing protein, partial [Candidatus Polarisedimenticolia bacterium]|nr:fibronectin type III domain-containing protein [Candidatus Polarisedimenticolia bacterium]